MPTLGRKTRKSHNHKKDPFYNSKSWRKAREICLRLNPWCVHCAMKGGKVKADTVDHIISKNRGGSLTDQRNLQSLCRSCHNKKSARDSNKKK